MKWRRNPYARLLKQPVRLQLDRNTVAYFRSLARESGIPYLTLIRLYLFDCAAQHRKLLLKWAS